MRINKTLLEILDEITASQRVRRQYDIEPECLDDPEYLDLEDILLAQNRAKRWLEDQS